MNREGPASLSRSARGKRSPWLILSGAVFFFGLIFLRLDYEQSRYEEGGIRVQGVVTEKQYTPGLNTTSKGQSSSFSSHYVMYRFTTKDGRTYDGKDDVLLDIWYELKVGDPVTVEYLADAPDTNQIPEQRARSNTFRIMGLASLLVGVALAGLGLREKRVKQQAGGMDRENDR